jgi:hypothetical protein
METASLNRDPGSLCWLKYTFPEGDYGDLISG